MLTAHPFLSLGIILLTGFLFSLILRQIKLPSVTSYLILGIIIGPFVLDLVADGLLGISGLLSKLVLSLIAFSIGQNFSLQKFREIGKSVIVISLAECIVASICAGGFVYLLTGDTFISLAFAALAPATAPAAVVMVVRECRSRGKFTDTLLGIVAFDDIWGLIIFSLLLAVLRASNGFLAGLLDGSVEIMGALALGVLLGWIFTYFIKYAEHESEILIYTLGFIVLTAGVSIFLNFSVLLANMALSATVVNINNTDQRVFKVIRNLDPPFYLLFFVLAGASLELDLLTTLGLMGGIYMVGRLGGKIIGAWLSSFALGFPQQYGFFLGIGLAPQAGAALGMAMIVENSFPEAGSYVLSTIVATTVIYEIFGPVLTRLSIYKSGEMPEER